MTWSIYMFTNELTGKSYIGLTSKTKEERWHKHKVMSRHTNYYFHNAIQKYDEEFWIKEYLCKDICSIKKAYELEQYYIKLYNTFYCGYNSTEGGEGGSSWYDIMTDKQKEEYSMLRSKISRKAFNTQAFIFYNPKLVIKEKLAVVDIVKKYNLNDRHIRDVSTGISKYHKGWFLWEGDNKEYSTKKLHSFYHDIFGDERISVKDMSKKYNIRPSQLYDVLSGRRNHTHGWKSKTLKESSNGVY